MDMIYTRLLNISAIVLVFVFAPAFVRAAPGDMDGDGLLDRYELMIGSNPELKDSDGDKWPDRGEVFAGYDPSDATGAKLEESLLKRDTDNDGLADYLEANINTDYQNEDSDGDGYADGVEIAHGFSPLDPGPKHYGKRIEVSKDRQTLSYFVGPHHINSFLVSTGLWGTDTPEGEFEVEKKIDSHLYQGSDYYYPNTKYNLRFKFHERGSYYIHGAYWHNNFGKRMSHGCVNVSYRDMEHLYAWADMSTPVSIH